MEQILTHQLLVPLLSISAAQAHMDTSMITNIQISATVMYDVLINNNVVRIPRLLFSGVRHTVITSARIHIDLHSTVTRCIQTDSSVTMSLETTAMPELAELLMNQHSVVEPTSPLDEETVGS